MFRLRATSLATLRGVARPLLRAPLRTSATATTPGATAAAPPPGTLRTLTAGLLAGNVMGAFGAIAGVGGSAVAVPLLTASKVATQHQAIGTALTAVMGTACFGSLTYWIYGGGAESVDLPAAALLTLSSVVTARLGARLSMRLTGEKLKHAFGGLVMIIAPSVVLKGLLHPVDKFAPKVVDHSVLATSPAPPVGFTKEYAMHLVKTSVAASPVGVIGIVCIGALTGVMAGMLGVGGGLVMVTGMSLMPGSNQQLALGTGLLSMLGPSMAGSAMHYRLGNVRLPLVAPLLLGSAIGALIGGQIAVGLTDQQQRYAFGSVMMVLAIRQLPPRVLWGYVRQLFTRAK